MVNWVLGRPMISSSGACTVRDFVTGQGGVTPVYCKRGFDSGCILSRGQTIVPAIYLDDQPTMGGLDRLDMVPMSDVARVEVLARGQQVRVYTSHFIEWAARSRYTPTPLLLF